MTLVLSPPYLALVGAVMLFLGVGEDAPFWTALGAVLLLIGLVSAPALLLHRRWIRRLRSDAHPVRAEVIGVALAPIGIAGRRPYRLTCRGLTPPAVGQIFRSGWILPVSTEAPPALVTVLLDPKQTSRSYVDVGVAQLVRTPLRRVLRHVGALGIVLGVAIIETIAIRASRPDAPLGLVHGEVQANGARFGKGGVHWRPDLCRTASNPGVTAVALVRKDDAHPVAWILTDPSSKVAAIDVQQSSGAETVRFAPSTCTRLHGEIRANAAQPGRPSGLAGYIDAECREPGAELAIHADFGDCR